MKIVSHQNDSRITKYKLFGITLVKINDYNTWRRYKVLGIKWHRVIFSMKSSATIDDVIAASKEKDSKLYFDIALGGGTESYFFNKLKNIRLSSYIFRVQYLPQVKKYKITVFNTETEKFLFTSSFKKLKKILVKCHFSEVVVNNIVSYPHALDVLKFIESDLKKEHVFVSARGHDFQPICPFFTLMATDLYCGCPKIEDCTRCFPKNKSNAKMKPYLLSGAKDIKLWRKIWNHFYEVVADELIVFSQSSYELFVKTYPCLTEKTKIIAHEVPFLRKANIPPHPEINIGILGAISSVAKGKNILKELESLIDTLDGVNLIAIGPYSSKNPRTKVIGAYERQNLPSILEENKIDIIFIPSVWPETFSYTTSEAILMDMYVACFNLGAPAERVSLYKKGLVISKMNAQTALNEIINFLKEKK